MMVAAALLVTGSVTSAWFESYANGLERRVSLRDVSLCSPGDCRVLDYERLAHQDLSTRTTIAVWSGRITHGVGLAAGLAAFVCSMILALRRTRHGAIVVVGLTLVAAASAVVFIAAVPDGFRDVMGWSARVFLAGSALALLGALLALGKVPLVAWDEQLARDKTKVARD